MGASYVGLALLLILSQTALSAPVADEPRDLQEQESYPAEGCYYNFEHYEEGDRIVTNEPCLNCTCHNHMLMCYLRVCPFTKAIGQDCTVEKKPDQCCPVITCPEVPVQLLTSSTTQKPTTISTAVGRPDNYGCTLSDNTFYPDGAQVPSDPRKPCELCYCIRNRTACVMQECTLQVEGCQPVYQQGVCCPVRYDCDYDSVTTPGTTVGLITTPGGPTQCLHDGVVYNDGEMVEFKGKSPCEHCYCMRGDVVCAVQECGTPLQAPDCVPLPPPPGHCCPDTFQCANGTVPLESLLGKPEAQDDSHSSEIHSGENSHSNEPAHDSAAEGSESSEEQKKPLGEDSGGESSASSQDAQNNIDGTHTLKPSDDKVTEPAIEHVPQENQVLDDNANHDDIEAGTEAHQDGETKPDVHDKTPEEHNIIYGEHDSKPVGDLISESLVHDKIESSDNAESQLPVEEDHIESKPNEEHDNDHQTILNETDNDLSPEDASLHNKGDGQDDSSALSHDDNKEKEQEHVNVNENEGEENVSSDITPVNLETSQTDSGESMVTGDDVEGHKGSSADNEEGKDQQENKDPSSIDSSHVDDKVHVSESIDTPQSSNTESPNESTNESQNVSYEPTHTQESSDLPESEAEKNRIHGVTPETYTEVSVETVEVHTSTPEINHPQENPTSQTSIIDSSLLSTEGPVATQADAHNNDESHNQGDQNEATTIISNDSLGDHDATTMLDSGNIPRLPGEGNCIIDGQTYKHNSDVHTRSACQVSCKCLNSIVHCKLVECPPAPTQYANCMPLEDHESCCPSYTCDDKPSLPLEVHSQVSTEFPEGAEQGESDQQEQHEYNGPSDHEEPSHDQAHSSSDGSEAPVEETKKPDEESSSSIETSSHDLDNSLEHSPPSKDGEPAEQNSSENENNLENVITHIPSNEEEGDSGKPASNDDNNENNAEVHLPNPSLEASQDFNQESETTQDSNPQEQLPHQNGEEETGNIQVEGGEISRPEDKHEEDIGIVSIEHDSNNVLANENQDKHEEHDSESVSHTPAEIPLESDDEKHSELEDSTVNEHKPENHQEETTSPSTDPTLITDENESSNLSPVAENDHPDEATLNQISNNEIIHQTHPESDHSPELHADGEITEPPTTSTAAQPIGSSSDTDDIPSELHEGVIDKEEPNEPQNHHDSENESSDQEVEISQNESGSGASDDHHQNENENEINHANDIPQGSSTIIEQPDHPTIGESIPDTHQTNNEEILTSDNANSNGTDEEETPEIEEQKVDSSSHGTDDNLVHNEVGSEVPHQPEVNENNEPQLHEHEATEPNQESGSNEVNGNEDSSLHPGVLDDDTSSQSSLHPSQHDSTSAEEENIVNPTTNEDSVSNLSEQTDNQQDGDNIAVSQNEMEKPEDHELPSQPQDNTIPIEDGVGGIVHHDTPNEIESVLAGEHPLPGVEKESGETQDDTSIHHTEQALEGTGEEHHDSSSPEGENGQGVSETHDSSEQHHEVSPGFGSDEHQPIESVGKEEETNQGTEESHEASVGTDNTESHIAPDETTHPENHGENILDENQHSLLTEDHQDETESNEVIEGSPNLQTGEDGGHGESDNSVENNHDTSVPVESIESQSEENEGPHKVEQETSEENSNQETSVPVNKEEEQHDSSDHEGGKLGSSEEEQHEVSQPSHEDNDQNQDHSLPTSEEGSHDESVSSDEGQHGTSSSTDSEVEQEHTSSIEEHLNEPVHHEGDENEHVPSEEEHEEIPTAHEDNNIEHAPTEVEHHDTSDSQETSTDKIVPTVEEHHDTSTVEEGGEAVYTPTEEEHHDTSALQEVSTGDEKPSEEEHHESSASQEDEHIDKPSSQETGELEQTHNAEEDHDSTASQSDDHIAAEEEEHQGHESPATQEVGSDEHSTSPDGHEDRPTSPEATEGDNTPSGEAQSESTNASEEQNIPTSEETEKESSSGESSPSQDHHDLSLHPATQDTDRPEDEATDDHKDHSSSEEQSHPETPVLETQVNEELSEKPSEPETNQDTAHPSSDSDSHEHLTDSIENSNEGQIENEAVDEISHHEDDVKPDLTIADHHIEEDHHNVEQGPSEDTAQEGSHKDSDTSGLPQDTEDQGLSHTDTSGEPQEGAVDDNTHNEIPSAPELTHIPESNEHQGPSVPEVNEESHIPHPTEPAEGTDGQQQNEQLEENVGSEQTEHSSVDQESGTEEHVGDQHAGQDSTQPQDSAVDENLSNQLGTEENTPVNLGDETNQDHSSHGSEQEDNSEPSEAAFHVEEHGNPTANPADSDAVINAVYAVVHQQEESSELGNSKKPSIGQDVDYTGSGIHDIDSTNQANDLLGQPPQELHEEHTPEEVHSENVPTEQHAENLPQEHHPEHIPEEHNTEHLSEEHLSEQSPEDHLPEHVPEEQPNLHTPVEHAESIPEENPESNIPVEHQQEHEAEANHDEVHQGEPDSHEHEPPVQHAPEDNEHVHETPEHPSVTEIEQPLVNEDSPDDAHGHTEHSTSTVTQTENEHSEGETNKFAEEVPVTDQKDSDQLDQSHHQTEAAAVPVEESKPDSIHEEPVQPIQHTPEHLPESEDVEKLPTASGQPELSTENAFTTVMHEIFGSTNVVTPDHQQAQENEYFQPGGPLFPNWSQKPADNITTSKPQTVPQIPEDSQYPYEQEQDYEEEDSNYSPGTCRYGGKVYLSAQQIPRDDPCDFCFCFRSDIICLQQSCPPPIQHCYQENIPGFCCPRYECHVSMATMVNVTTTTTTTTTTLPPHFLAHAYKGHAKRTGCQVKGVAYRVGERIASTSGPCLECRCGADGQMKCDPTVCNPQETLLRQVMDAAVISRRRRHIMTTPYFTARRLR